MPNKPIRLIASLLVPVMVLTCGLPPAVCAQTSSSEQGNLTAVGSSTDSDKTNDYILIGLFAVVVGILVILGVQSDFYNWSKDEPAESYAWSAGEDDLPRDIQLAAPEHDSDVALTAVGLRARF